MENELWIYDVIGKGFFEVGVTAESVRDELAKFDKSKPIQLYINSPGGSVSHAVTIHTMLSQWKAGVDVQIDGEAASAASYIAMVGREITIADGGWLMIHNAMGLVAGNAAELRKVAGVLDDMSEKLGQAYAARTGKPLKEILAMMAEETWFTSDKAIEAKFADRKLDIAAAACRIPEAFGFKHPPHPAEPPKQRPFNSIAAKQRQLDLTRAAISV